MPVTENFWAEAIDEAVPAPISILREQGEALALQTDGRLFGEVLDSAAPTKKGIDYGFYIGVTDKPHRYKLLTVNVPLTADYPVVVNNHDAGSTTKQDDQAAFENYLKLILGSAATKDILRRMMFLANSVK